MPKGTIIAGIDVGTEKICTIIAAVPEDSQRLTVIGVSSQPAVGVRKSQIVDIEEAIAAITESVEGAERMAGFSLQHAYVSISGSHIASLNSKGVVAVSEPGGEIIADDVTRVIEAARAVSMPATREILHVIPRNFKVDDQEGIKDPIGMTGTRLEAEAHVITAATAATKNLAKCISETGIEIDELVFSGLASAEAVLNDTERELGVALVDIGAGSTSICVFVEGSVAHSAVLPVGARNITNDIAIGMRVSLDSAEKIKRFLSESSEQASPYPVKADENRQDRMERRKRQDEIDFSSLNLPEAVGSYSRKAILEGIVRPRLNEMFQMIAKELDAVGVTPLIPAGIVLTGGGAETVMVVDTCKKVLSLPTRVGNPSGLTGLIDEVGSSAYAAANGLILYAKKTQTGKIVRPSMPSFKMPKSFPIPVQGIFKKLVDLIKNFMP